MSRFSKPRGLFLRLFLIVGVVFTPLISVHSGVSAQSSSPPDLIFADGFESGNLSAWTSSTTDNGNLSVSAAAALVGSQGMQALINDNNAISVTDDSPSTEPRYRARFYFDPNSITMTNGNTHYIFYGLTGTSTVVCGSSSATPLGSTRSGRRWSTMAPPGHRVVGPPSATHRTSSSLTGVRPPQPAPTTAA